MSYKHAISEIVKVVEGAGAGILVIGRFGSFVVFVSRARHAHTAQGASDELRRNLGRCILLGLEVLIVADTARTIMDLRTRPGAGAALPAAGRVLEPRIAR